MKELDWKILIVLYEKHSITKTAEALYLTQSAVAKRLQSIEAECQIVADGCLINYYRNQK